MPMDREEARAYVERRTLRCPCCGQRMILAAGPGNVHPNAVVVLHAALEALREADVLHVIPADEAVAALTSGREVVAIGPLRGVLCDDGGDDPA